MISTSIYSSCEILQSKIESKYFVGTDQLTYYLRKIMQERMSDIRMGFVIRNKFGGQYSVIMNR